MKAIYKKELKSYFTSMTGYIFIAFLIAIIGMYFMAYNLNYAYPYFSYTLSSASFIYIIIVPIITMRIMAEERKQKTDQMLFTAPVSIEKIVMGKYFSLLTILAMPMVLFCIYPLLLSTFGTVNFAMAYTGILGFFLMGAAFMAIGLFISSLTESMVIAAVLSFGALFLSYMMEGISGFIPSTAAASYIGLMIIVLVLCFIFYTMMNNVVAAAGLAIIADGAITVLYFVKSSLFESALPNMLSSLSLTSKFSDMSSGTFDITGIVYYLTVCGLFLFLTVQSVQKRRYS